ncbi:hypothetical protein GE21DRAFT_1311133 [Neurospora crassa]|nr:hypothetical protein GE21DRAFT_1311133 [Neurospora crassa]
MTPSCRQSPSVEVGSRRTHVHQTPTPLSNNTLFTTLCSSEKLAFANIPARDSSLSWLLPSTPVVDLYPAAIDFAKENVASLYTDGRAKFVEADVRKFEKRQSGSEVMKGDPEGYHAVTVYFSLLPGFETYEIRDKGGLFSLGTVPMEVEGELIGRSQVLEAVRQFGFRLEWETTRKFASKAVEVGILRPKQAHLFVYAVQTWYP